MHLSLHRLLLIGFLAINVCNAQEPVESNIEEERVAPFKVLTICITSASNRYLLGCLNLIRD